MTKFNQLELKEDDTANDIENMLMLSPNKP